MLPRIASVVLVALLTTAGFAADKPFVRVHWKGASFRITYKSAVMTYDLQTGDAGSRHDGMFMAQINKITTDYLERKNDIVYMILDIEGNSRGQGGAMGYCGSGEEKGKGLFVFNENGEQKAPAYVTYESCFNTIESDISNDEPPAVIPAGRLLTRFEYYRSPEVPEQTRLMTVSIYFDENHPENGMTPVETCVMFQTWIKSNRRVACPTDKGK